MVWSAAAVSRDSLCRYCAVADAAVFRTALGGEAEIWPP